MSDLVIKNSQDVYTKHHSFAIFHTNIAADKSVQKTRVLDAIKVSLGDQTDDNMRQVLLLAYKDLSKTSSEESGLVITQHIADELSRIEDRYVVRYIFHRYRYDIYPQLRKLDQYPPYLQIEPTSICNFRCIFCYQTDKEFTAKSSGHMGSMTFDLFKEILDQVEGKVEFLSLASRGEPMACKDIDRMLEYSVGKFLGLKINTNASLLNEKHCHAILAGGVNTVVFSADAAVEPMYSQLRVGGKLAQVLKNIELFNQIKAKHYPLSKIISRVSGVKVNEEQGLDSMRSTWGGLVDQLSFVKYNPWENVYDSSEKDIHDCCSDLYRRMFIWYDGKINPCDTDYRSTLSTGSIQDSSISNEWLSKGYQQLRELHGSGKRSTVEPCKRCTVI